MQMDFCACMYGETEAWMSGVELGLTGASSMSNLLCYL